MRNNEICFGREAIKPSNSKPNTANVPPEISHASHQIIHPTQTSYRRSRITNSHPRDPPAVANTKYPSNALPSCFKQISPKPPQKLTPRRIRATKASSLLFRALRAAMSLSRRWMRSRKTSISFHSVGTSVLYVFLLNLLA